MSLPLHTRLGEFEIISVIGEGGFSIVYLAHDHQLERTVAIKEYLPGAIAYRNADGIVLPRFEKYESTFKTGLQSFLKEARILAQFEHHSLIRIHRFWEQNGTAYMVMQYCQGKTMRQILQNDPERGRDEGWLKQVIAPVLDALKLLHSRNCYHRDLSPDNIMILDSGAPMLLDFGAARQVIGDMTQALTVILKPGFAPIEQYADDESMRQGPWTDIYGAGAVLYFAAAGKAPTASVARLVKDPIKKLSAQPDLPFTPQFSRAVDHALALFPPDRPQSIEEFAAELFANEAPVSPYQVLPTLSGAAVAASAEAARQQAARDLHAEEAASSSSSSQEPQAVGSAASNALLQPAHEEWTTSQPASPAPVGAPVEDKVVHTTSEPTATVVQDTEPVATATDADRQVVPESRAPSEPTAKKTAKQEPVPAHKPPTAKNPPTQPRREPRSPPQVDRRRPWGMYAGGAVAALAVLALAAYFLGGSSQPPAPPVQVSTESERSAQPAQQASVEPTTPVPPASSPAAIREQDAREPEPVASSPVVTPRTAVVPASATVTSTPVPPVSPVPPAQPTTNDGGRGTAVSQSPSASAPQTGRTLPGASTPGNSSESGRELPTRSSATTASAPGESAATSAVPNKPGAFVKFAIRPWGKVIVNGVEKGTSPPMVRMWLPEGDHRIVIENADFPSYSTSVKVEDKKDASVSYKFGR
ncbi:serine/threonine protein kinase [Diaphorobacter aerolatus]|uniref:non-specific serine/threonine protein kinase n=1 Tax=Diaphorobacter aerolatus TaxID=1288495 RepID=A0A7H0GLB3_9BURK|nr:serine/threonine-protein kinase [Diaphorobacter aerolatus]QNP49079.1 protein kinase [Diaphorobacter aerolatus]